MIDLIANFIRTGDANSIAVAMLVVLVGYFFLMLSTNGGKYRRY